MTKRFLLIFLATSLLIIGFFTGRTEIAKAYAVCRTEMLSIEGYGVWKLQNTSLHTGIGSSLHPKPGIDFVFNDGTNDAICSASPSLSGWQTNGDVWQTIVGCLGCPEGKFGVSP